MKGRAEIVGGGFAGLTAACALAQRGWRVRVHERADRLRTAGAGINLYQNGLRVLEAVGAARRRSATARVTSRARRATRKIACSRRIPGPSRSTACCARG
jgi:2-polyprenyl-6-methoxyphenol hydroxylase-like FAD-dependent oxidoreductase